MSTDPTRSPDAACVCPARPCPVHAPSMTDLMVSPEAIDACIPSPEWAVREYEEVRDELLSLRKLYGAKFDAITTALGYVSEGILHVESDNTEAGLSMLREAERVLLNA